MKALPPDRGMGRRAQNGRRAWGGGHTWPGSALPLPGFIFGRTSRTFSATRVIWDFLAAHARGR